MHLEEDPIVPNPAAPHQRSFEADDVARERVLGERLDGRG